MAEPLKSAAELTAEIRGEDPSSDHKDDPKTQKEWTFQFEHRESGTGKLRKGPFTNQILTLGLKRQVGVLQAQMASGVPYSSLSPFDRDLLMTIAHLMISLVKRPKWAANLEDLYDQDLLDKLYKEVADHEATFHGRGSTQKKGGGDSGPKAPDGKSDDLAPGEASAE